MYVRPLSPICVALQQNSKCKISIRFHDRQQQFRDSAQIFETRERVVNQLIRAVPVRRVRLLVAVAHPMNPTFHQSLVVQVDLGQRV